MAAFGGSKLELRLLGELQVLRNGEPQVLPPSKKTRALLSYLVLSGKEHRRDRLCSLLWDVTDDPRGALRWSISKLRALCDEPTQRRIVADREKVRFELAGARVDVLHLRERLKGPALREDSVEALEELAREFRGELLTGLELGDFDEFQAFCGAEREQARRLQQSLLRALVERSPSAERALPHARALVHLDPLSQTARASLVALLGDLGRRQEAEQQYRAGRKQLAELGARDTAELDAAWAKARESAAERAARPQHSAPPLESVAPSAPEAEEPPPSRAVPLVGREREREQLLQLLAEAGQGRGRVVLLSGEAGVGKTRLLRELTSVASRLAGATVLCASAYEVESGRPYGPWIDALRQVPRPAVGSRLARELAVLVPEWASDPVEKRSEELLFGAVSELLAARAHSAPPVVLAIDDVHWLDEPSSRLLHYVARMQRHRPVLLALTARDGELLDNPALTRAVRSLRREGILQELPVGPLNSAAIEILVAHLSAEADAKRLHTESGGNPLFAIELCRTASEAGAIPPTLFELIRERVQALPSEAADALRWAALLGGTFEVARLEALLGAAESVTKSLELLQRRALLLPDRSRGAGVFGFTHDVIRRAIYADVSEPRRRLMHRRVAEQLAQEHPRDESEVADLVHHAALGGQPRVAARACLRAAEHCVKLFANRDAEALVRRGFFHAKQLPALERNPLEVELWRVQLAARRPEQSAEVAAELQRLGERTLDQGAIESARLAFHLLSWLRWEDGDWSGAIKLSLRAEQLSRELSEPAQIAAMAEAARCLVLGDGDLAAAEVLLLEASARAERAHVLPSSIPDARGLLSWHRGELPQAVAHFEQAREVSRREADRLSEFQALEHRLGALLELPDPSAAKAVARELTELGDKLRGGSEAPAAQALAALLQYAEHKEPEPLEAALEALRRVDAKQRLTLVLLHAAELDLQHGRAALARRRAREALAAATALARRSDAALSWALLGHAARELGDEAEQAACLKQLLALPPAKLSWRARGAVQRVTGDAAPPSVPTKSRSKDGVGSRRASPG